MSSLPSIWRIASATQIALDRIVAAHPIDAVVNNIGLVRPQRFGSIELDDLAAVLDLNLRPALQTAQAAVPAMKRAAAGRASSTFPA